MNETETSTDAPERPTLSTLLVELTRDARSFAAAEVAYLKAQAGERAHFAVPGLIMVGIAIAIGMGILIAVPIGFVLLLTPMIGAGWAMAGVTGTGLGMAALLLKFGVRRIKAVLKRPEER